MPGAAPSPPCLVMPLRMQQEQYVQLVNPQAAARMRP